MFIDEAKIIVIAGHGGPGKVHFFPGAKAGPDGGNGGRGGDVYIKATTDLMALRPFTHEKILEAKNGDAGDFNTRSGLNGQDLEILLPVGSVLEEEKSHEVIELSLPDQTMLVAKGGLGGLGNAALANSRRTTPEFAQPGLPGEEKHFKIILKLIADFGLIGLPNAGKSSLLNELTAAQAKIGAYPFTTLEPNLGVFSRKILADIPGLIEGASGGKGLGIKFLKHIEKTHTLLHCIAADSDDVKRDYQTVRKELKEYNLELLEKREVILLTKIDLVEPKEVTKKLKILEKLNAEVLTVSIHDWDSLERLKKLLSD